MMGLSDSERELMRKDLKLPSSAATGEEAVAEALWQHEHRNALRAWSMQADGVKRRYRRLARVALAAAPPSGATDDLDAAVETFEANNAMGLRYALHRVLLRHGGATDPVREADELLRRLDEWDQMNVEGGDGVAYWKREIARVRSLLASPGEDG